MKLDPYLEKPFLPDPSERRNRAEELRDREVSEQAQIILSDPELLDEAVGDFGNELSFTGLFHLLSNVAQCETAEQFCVQGAALKEHLQSISYWQADRQVPPVSIFHKPQAF